MPFFEVTLSDNTTAILQAHNKAQLKTALEGVTIRRQYRHCKQCRKAAATVQNTLCPPCWDEVLMQCREMWKDLPMSEQEIKDTAMSYFVDMP